MGELDPKVANYYDTLGQLQYTRNNVTGALTTLQKAVQLDPKNPEFLYHIGVIYAKTGNKTKASEVLKRALNVSSTFPSSAEAKNLLKTLD